MVTPTTLPGGARNPYSAPTGQTPDESSVAATTEDSSAVRTNSGSLPMDAQPEHETAFPSQPGVAKVIPSTPEDTLMHLHNEFATEELDAGSTAKDFLVVRTGSARQVRRRIGHCYLDANDSVGYRVDSQHAASAPHSASAVPASLRNARGRFTPRSMR